MIIRLPDINRTEYGPLFLGERQRLATCTAVKFIDDDRLLAASLVGLRIYLMRYEMATGHHEILDDVATRFDGKPAMIDLIDFDGGETVAASNFHHRSASLYRLAGDRLEFDRDLPIDDPDRGCCHGVKFVPPENRILCLSTVMRNHSIYFIDVAENEIVYKFADGEWRPKDICFIDRDLLIVAATDASPAHEARRPPVTKFSLVELDLSAGRHRILDEMLVENCHADCCRHAGGKIYVADQMSDMVRILAVDRDGLRPAGEIGGYSFPHGLDILPEAGLLAVANYGNNSLVLKEL